MAHGEIIRSKGRPGRDRKIKEPRLLLGTLDEFNDLGTHGSPAKAFQFDKKKSRHDRAARWVISGANPISLEETAAGAFAHAGKVL